MYNFFTHRRHLETTAAESRRAARSARTELQREQRRDELRKESQGRAVEWAGKHMTAEYAQAAKDGGVMLFHPSAHPFRVTPKESVDSIYVRHYEPAKVRASAAETDYRTSHLGVAFPYNTNSPHTHTDWIRKPDPSQFLFGSRTVHRPQSDENRLKTSASEQRLVELSGFNKAMVAFPKFRTRNKAREVDLVPFNEIVKGFDRTSSAWTTPKIYDSEAYIDGFQVTGDISKRREKSKEVCPTDFALTSPKDPWKKWTQPGQSLRQQKSEDQLLRLDLVKSPATGSTKSSPKAQEQKFYAKTYETQKALGIQAPVRRVSLLNTEDKQNAGVAAN